MRGRREESDARRRDPRRQACLRLGASHHLSHPGYRSNAATRSPKNDEIDERSEAGNDSAVDSEAMSRGGAPSDVSVIDVDSDRMNSGGSAAGGAENAASSSSSPPPRHALTRCPVPAVMSDEQAPLTQRLGGACMPQLPPTPHVPLAASAAAVRGETSPPNSAPYRCPTPEVMSAL